MMIDIKRFEEGLETYWLEIERRSPDVQRREAEFTNTGSDGWNARRIDMALWGSGKGSP
jgi:hypothetical protein